MTGVTTEVYGETTDCQEEDVLTIWSKRAKKAGAGRKGPEVYEMEMGLRITPC